jgi:rhodanese-related sulfurtransferase
MSQKQSKSKNRSFKSTSHWRQKTRKRNLTWLWVGLGVLVVVIAGILVFSPKSTPSVEISPAQAYAKYQQGAFFLDVRNQEEWNQFHVKGSTLIPLDELKSRLNEVPKDKDIVLVCLSGHRSQSGTTILQQAGFTHVSCLSGGLQAWRAAGYPVEGNVP